MGKSTRHDRSLLILDGKVYRIRSVTDCDGWLADLCGYSKQQCRETVVLSQMFGIYRYMGWIAGLKKNHSRVLKRLYRERKEQAHG